MYLHSARFNFHKFAIRFSVIALILLAFVLTTRAQQSRITKPVDNRQRVALNGHLHPQARTEFDRGRVAPGLELSTVMLTLSQTADQKTALDQLVKEQQTPGSANYHHWLTPEQYAERFGASESDIAKIRGWLEAQGLTIASVARGRNAISVNGTASQFEAAFQTELHHYMVGTELHFANSTEPTIPAAFSGVIASIRGLHDFRMKAKHHAHARPDYTSGTGHHYLAPNDFATIYNASPLYAAGFDGTGQTVVIAGQTQVDLSDISLFRNSYNLSANPPQVLLVPGTKNPGISSDDLAEADLDIEWSGAVARGATILYVYTQDVMTAVQYAIDQNLAPVVSTSYGLCELETAGSDVAAFRSWALQGNSQGITWFSASGDSGGADCYDSTALNSSDNGLAAVDTPGSIPEVTSVGGTEFSEGASTFWNNTNDPNSASAMSYIPEVAWNDSVQDGEPSAGGGGASIYFTKPNWQVGPGVPNDNQRHVPDISLNASADHDGYLVYTGGQLQVYGGTSVPTPCFAGIAALLNQYLVSKGASAGVGNINPNLYALAQTNPGIFHDVTGGNNIVTANCPRKSPNCGNLPVGYNAGVGYDQATGLGSVDVTMLVTGWSGGGSIIPTAPATMSLLSNISSLGTSDTLYLISTVTNPNGITPTGSVTFDDNGTTLGSAPLVGSAGSARATLVVKGSQLAGGSSNITASYASVSSKVNVTLSSSGSAIPASPAIAGLTDSAQFQPAFSPGALMSIFGTQLTSTTPQSAAGVPLPISMGGVVVLVNGVPAPLYYASDSIINVQIPYETAIGGATVTVNNNGRVFSQGFTVTATAPAVFTDSKSFLVPQNTAARGQEIAFYMTGVGQVSPALFTGSAPSTLLIADLPAPLQTPVVRVGNQIATLDFVGIPDGLVGVTQINFTVPFSVTAGLQTVTVTVGGKVSGVALLNVTN
jgi:uncharacterized protein (TIGR03437 family)